MTPFRECECCGQALPWGIDGLDVPMTPTEEAIYRIVQRSGSAGIPSDVLTDRLYSDRRDGGPLSGRVVVRVHIWKLNQKLRRKLFQISSHKGGNHVPARYYLLKLKNKKWVREDVV